MIGVTFYRTKNLVPCIVAHGVAPGDRAVDDDAELAAGQAPHAPHRHAHEELILIREGALELTMEGQKTALGPGSGVYVASDEEHGFRNSGAVPAKYFVLALGQD